VKAHGKTYTPELAQDQLRVFVTAVVDQQEKVKGLQEGIEGKDEALGRLQQALFTARNRIAGLESKGAKLVEEKAVAELKATSMAISNAVAGLDPKAPLSGAMLEIRELIDAMQEHVDGQLAQADVATEMGHAGGELISANEAIGDGGYNGRHERIESQLQKALAGE
jgi:phage shock protein A